MIAHERMQDRLYVVFVGSAVGGTGSSMFVDLGALLRHLLHGRRVEMSAFLTTADVYENVLAGTPEEYERVKANQ